MASASTILARQGEMTISLLMYPDDAPNKWPQDDDEPDKSRNSLYLQNITDILYMFHSLIIRKYLVSNHMNLNVRVSGSLKDHVTASVDAGDYENVSEFVRDLIRQHKAQMESKAHAALKTGLQHDFAAPRNRYRQVTAQEVIERNRSLVNNKNG